ncbi:hypothetical protein QE361_000023 [Sphingomonas sp. SORGH_AS802]|uniref:hypothetical protein n=1 Tax=Sphingomonas sp. SORGH_AS_0802 TaxID=3041800 RepID=UPI002864B788|nr:hypothetical protein [Sphingomonas sp. SORGH_AS_0802]MDR6133065.1 hypothetical protein [Sphingomonas sp. SORGH_AS_0802]
MPSLREIDNSMINRTFHWRMKNGSALGLANSSLVQFPLYKATQQEYFDDFMESGSLRIGTLWDFRRTDIYGNSVGDRAEGVASCRVKLGASEAWIANAERDQFIFCASSKLDWNYFQDEGYDAVYRINSSAFFLAIAEKLAEQHPLDMMLISPVAYTSQIAAEEYAKHRLSHILLENLSRSQGVFPAALVKLLSYSGQNEVRAIFQETIDRNKSKYKPLKNDNDLAEFMELKSEVEPVIIHVPEAIKHITPCTRT